MTDNSLAGLHDPTGATAASSIVGRLERLPFTRIHRSFLLMVASGEFVESLMLLGNGAILAIVASVLGFSPTESAYVVPISFFAGEFVGSIVIGYLSDRLGRRTMFAYDLLVFGVGIIIAGFFSSPALIAIFLFISGIGCGGEFPLVDTYTTEVFPSHQRGKRLAMVYTLAVIAAPLIAGLAYLLSHPKPGPLSWRIIFWVIGVLALVVWFVRLRMPESPRWLEVNGRHEDADEIVSSMERDAMRQYNLTDLPPVEVEDSVSQERGEWRDLWSPRLRGRTVMMLVFQFFQSGIFYGFASLAPTFLLDKGISLVHSLLFTMIIYAGFLVGSIANTFYIDKVERKWGIVTTAILAGVLGTAFVLVANVVVTVVLGFLVAFTLWNFSNFYHTYQAEIFPTRVRSMAAGTVYSVSRISTSILVAIIVTFFLPMGLLPTYGVIWVFIVIVVVAIGLFGPRTSRLRLEEISE